VERHAKSNDLQERLMALWVETGDASARERLLCELLPVARQLARRYSATGEPYEDLVQVATIGLVKAVDRFDPKRGSSVRTYAARVAEGELLHHMRDRGLMHLPRELYTRARLVLRTTEQLAIRSGRHATVTELADTLHLSRDQVTEALQAVRFLQVGSLDASVPGLEADDAAYDDRVGADDPRIELVEARLVIERVWRALDPREREALRLRIVEDLTYREIAARLGMSVTHVARLAGRALERLRAVAGAGEVTGKG
jgi:RNA polymerase sigma-B factor